MRGAFLGLFMCLSVSHASAQGVSLGETSSNKSPTFNINKLLQDKAPSLIKLRIPNTPDGIRTAELYDDRGRKINFRFLLDTTTGLILGTHLDNVTIELIHDASGGFIIVARDAQGNLIELNPDDLSLTDINFSKRCFTLEDGDASTLGVNIGIALDVSGSMRDSIGDVSRAFQSFVNASPAGSMCRVLLFDGGVYNYNPNGSYTSYSPREAKLCKEYAKTTGKIPLVGGGTYISQAGRILYDKIMETPDARNIVILLTDGADHQSVAHEAADLVKQRDQAIERTGVYTVINFLGDYDPNAPISQVGDQTIVGFNGVKAGQAVFNQTTQFIQAQKVLNLAACNN